MDLVARLIAELERCREEINASALANGHKGWVELHFNPKLDRVQIRITTSEVLFPNRLRPPADDSAA